MALFSLADEDQGKKEIVFYAIMLAKLYDFSNYFIVNPPKTYRQNTTAGDRTLSERISK